MNQKSRLLTFGHKQMAPWKEKTTEGTHSRCRPPEREIEMAQSICNFEIAPGLLWSVVVLLLVLLVVVILAVVLVPWCWWCWWWCCCCY